MATNTTLLISLLVSILCTLHHATAVPTCPSLSKLANGRMSGTCNGNVTARKTCTFSCNSGYYLKGPKKLTCLGYTWDNLPPVCQGSCPALDAPLNGEMFGSCKEVPIMPGIPCLFNCDFGYLMKGPGMVTCGNDYKWTDDPPTCVRACPSLGVPSNSTMRNSCEGDVKPGQKCSFKCATGFVLRGNKEMTCLSNLKWNGTLPACVNSCLELIPGTNMKLVGKCKGAKAGEKCGFSCLPGYFLKGNAEVTCKADFEWDNQKYPSCVNSCPELTPGPKFKFTGKCKGAKAGDKCGFSCLPGYFLEGKAEVTCKADFEWDSQNYPRCVEVCPTVTQPSNGIMSGNCSGNLTTGDKCSFDCNKGFLMKGDKEIICQANKIWNQNPPACVNSCPELGEGCKGVKAGEECTFSCPAGYFLVGREKATCQPNLEWDSQSVPRCERVCPKLLVPENGTYEGKCNGTARLYETCTFSCSPGFALKGTSVLTCSSLYQWNYSPPKCVNTCDAVSVLGADKLEGKCDGSAKVNEKCVVSCPKDSALRGEKELVCNQKLEWNKPFPTCVNSCDPVEPPTDVRVDGNCRDTISVNQTCRFFCEDDFRLVGNKEITCGKDYIWNGTTPKCEQLECSEYAPYIKALSSYTTWNEYCTGLQRQCTEPPVGQVLMECGPCVAGFKEDPALVGKRDEACIANTKCNEVQSGTMTWAKYCSSLYRVCVESTAKCGQCKDYYVEDPTLTGSFDKACAARAGCLQPYEYSRPKGPSWTQHCAEQNKECTSGFLGLSCGKCLRGFKPASWPSDPCVSGAAAIASWFLTAVLVPSLATILTRF